VRDELQRAWSALEGEGLESLGFDGGEEMRASGRTKGSAVQQVLAESPHAVCAYLGDDSTDEDAFQAVRPRGLGVLVRPTLRPTRASLWIEPPAELLAFLARWRAAAEAR
jgi:trehalose-phosphatase